MSYTERSDCRLCGGGLERVLDLGVSPLANALVKKEWLIAQEMRAERVLAEPLREFTAPLYLSRCLTCGHVQLPVVVDPKLLFPADYPYASATGEATRAHLRTMAEDLTFGMDEGALAVEIGSNDGYLLSCMRDRVRAVGVDPAANLGREATERGDLTVAAMFTPKIATAIRNACGPADLIVANNVFAHADDLNEIVEGVKVLLAPEGQFVFEVGWLADVVRANNWPALYHEHLSVHSVAPLHAFFRRHGLILYEAWPIDTQGGSLRCYVWRPDGKAPSPEATMQMEEIARIESRWCNQAELAAWQSRVTRSAEIFAMGMRGLKTKFPNTTIAGYGCSAKSTTLLHVAGIGRETIDFICDSNPLKQGKFSPGKHIPIVHPDELEKRQPDVCVSLSGNFSEAFRARHPGFKGEWIEPQLNPSSEAA